MRRAPLDLLAVLALPVLLGACAAGAISGQDDGDDDGQADAGAGGGGSGGGGGGGDDDPTAGCERTIELEVAVESLPPDLMLVVDRSSSMGQSIAVGSLVRKWDVMVDALGALLEGYASRARFGLILAPPPGELCAAGDVEVAPADDTGGAIASALAAEPGGGTPMAGSLRAALAYYQDAPTNPYGRYVVLATDGLPSCDLDAVGATMAAIGALRQAGVKTFVLGYDADGAATLDDFAAAGGTDAAIPTGSAAELEAALAGITTSVTTVACEYVIPDGPPDANRLSITVGGAPVPYDPSHADGWDYDPATGVLTFHGAACDALRDGGAEVLTAKFCQIVE